MGGAMQEHWLHQIAKTARPDKGTHQPYVSETLLKTTEFKKAVKPALNMAVLSCFKFTRRKWIYY